MKRILLTEENLTELIKGKVVEINEVQIALEDIGFDRIINTLIEYLE